MTSALLLTLLAVAPTKTRVFLDAGHGVGTNSGTRTSACTDEADFVLALAKDVARILEDTGRFEVRLSRTDARGPSYRRRLAAAERFRADVLISLHIDARGAFDEREVAPGQTCPVGSGHTGFAILVSDEGDRARAAERRRWSRAIARAMSSAKFEAYDGLDYGGIYLTDEVPGVFVDRRRLFMLRRPPMPSVIVETHHALHPKEHARWLRPDTRLRFARALVVAIENARTTQPSE